MEIKRPVAYICHTIEDKATFVAPFAKKLAEKGIQVSVEPWELSHGESLIEKIFTEGIKSADAFIVVLSDFSVRKSWITEELRPGLVKRISAHSKLIPVLIDDSDVPEPLKAVPVVTIRDVNHAEREVSQIVDSLYGGARPTEPSILTKPAEEPVQMIPGLSKDELEVLKLSCEYSVEKERRFINVPDIYQSLEKKGISAGQLNKILMSLDEKGLVKAGRILGNPNIDFFNTTVSGFETYARAYLDGFDGLIKKILSAVANEGLMTNDELSSSFNLPLAVVNYIIDILVERDAVKLGKATGGTVLIKEVTPVGKRELQS
jgi:hypothetical protein